MSPPFPFIPPPSARNPRLNPSSNPLPPNGFNFSMVVTISHINYPETHLPRFTHSLFCYLILSLISPFPIISFPLLLPWSVFRSFLINHAVVVVLFSKKILCQHFSQPQQHPFTSHFISFPPSKISNFANFPLPNITSPHHDFFPPNFTLPTFLFHQIYIPPMFLPPPLPTYHLPPLLTFLLPTINPPTLFTNPPLQNISRSTFLLPTITHLTLFINQLFSQNSSNITSPTLFTNLLL